MRLILYTNNEEKNVLNKKLDDTTALILNGNCRNSVDIIHPIIELEGDTTLLQYNYMYIEDLQRYYFIDKYTALSNNLYIVNLTIDVLKTYENKIKELNCEIVKSSNPTQYKCEVPVLDTYQEKKIVYDNPFNFNGNNVLISVTSERVKPRG